MTSMYRKKHFKIDNTNNYSKYLNFMFNYSNTECLKPNKFKKLVLRQLFLIVYY